eukprot:gnl/TRDRNA2_/TRDRNA2_44556_c0_seq1.p1 gnl/TRDRNA2_/TRDRNA2_44556_c0~~gnl/TRDRNA2_/TRDRNA2_44556_c0_seq1.p1  ORF type:complete len:265 (+),score=35.11 gnl/TRDRNA2_/TRDRNA2_44556_c0_seq1:69-797(+)
MAAAPRLRLLCLHGSGLSGAFFRSQLGSLPRLLGRNVELRFLDGQLETEVAPEAAGAWQVVLPPENRRAWQYFDMFKEGDVWRAGDVGAGLDTVWDTVREEVAESGPFFGALGFSQGANVATALLARQHASGVDLGLRSVACLCGGFWGFWPAASWTGGRPGEDLLPLPFPSLHVLGRADPYLAQSRDLVECYADGPGHRRTVIEHDGGHMPFPPEKAARTAVMKQVSEFLLADAASSPRAL